MTDTPLIVTPALLDRALETPILNTEPLPEYGYDRLDYGMTLSIERTPRGRLWACWVGGGDSDKGFFVLATSDDDGVTWSDPRLVIDPHDAALPCTRRALVGALWTDPLGRLWLFFDQSLGYFDGRAGCWATRCDQPDAATPAWTKPVRLADGCTLNKPIVLGSGEWLLPVSLWNRERIAAPFAACFTELDPLRGASVFASTDQGETWVRRGLVVMPSPQFDEHHLIERRDGSLWLTARTALGLHESVSADGGRSWSVPVPSAIRHLTSRHHLRRLQSGRLLLVKHGETIDRTPDRRSHLCAFLSEDDGATWRGGLLLDARACVSYPDGTQGPDGTIYISYDYNRAEAGHILLARFTEEDVLAGQLVSSVACLKGLISRPLKLAVSMKKTQIHLGTQYYRPPFPRDGLWEEDFRRIREAGLNTVQLWVLWSWVEAVPGKFVFDDYDRLVDLARKNDLRVVLSTIAEVQPHWIHREIPGSEMVTNMGIKVVSSNRGECHFGLTPGGCTDHPQVWARMATFLEAVGTRYAAAPNLAGWDVWNELRWNVQADGAVCYCAHTVRAFRTWLERRYGGLDGLNAAWERRYGQWDEVQPGKVHGRPYTEMMAWEHFLTDRAVAHARARYDVLKVIDPRHPVTLHGGAPSPEYGGGGACTPLDRGNDWHFADHLDGVGCSSFPKWFHIDDADFGLRIEYVRSAARGKRIWLSELQGGRSAQGLEIHDPVDARSQQRWVWNGLACGADTILFWCWRDEVFTCEAGGYGLIGLDGLAEERLAAMRVTGRVLRDHEGLLARYCPDTGPIGVLFSPQSYYYYAAQEGHAGRPQAALRGVCRALVRRSIPFTVVEETHLEALEGLRALYLPRATALSAATQEALLDFVRKGGLLVVESECGAFSEAGLYRYPEERFLARAAGLREVGRRQLAAPAMHARLADQAVELPGSQWLTPLAPSAGLTVYAADGDGALLAAAPLGKGRILYCASYPSDAYLRAYNPGFEAYLGWIARAVGWEPDIAVITPQPTDKAFLYVKYGASDGRRLVFVFFHGEHEVARLRFRPGFFRETTLTDLISGARHRLSGPRETGAELQLVRPEWGFAVLVEDAAS